MFISTCLECYDGDSGDIVSVTRLDEDEPICQVCGGFKYYAHTNHHSGIADGDYSHASLAMAVNPEQVNAHRKLFPSVDISNGGVPTFTSVKQHEKYADTIGMVKKPQKIRKSRFAQRIA